MKLCINCRATFDAEGWNCPACDWEPPEDDGLRVFAPDLVNRNQGWNPDHFPALAELEQDSFWFRARNRFIVWALGRYFPRARRYLEVGCGTGYVLSGVARAFPEMTLAACDGALEGLRYARQRCPRAVLFQSDVRQLPFHEEFDVVGAFDVLEHVGDDQTALGNFFDILRPGAGLLVTVPQHRWLWSAMDEIGGHCRRYTRRELSSKLAAAGFDLIRSGSFVCLPLPLMLLSRLTLPKSADRLDPAAELRLGRLPNFLLEQVLDLELLMTRAGLTLPVGGSLFAAARKPMPGP